MSFNEHEITDEQREACAVEVMCAMLQDYCDDTGEAFADALDEFGSSRAYLMLFDFSTRLWAEGPDYLRATWKGVNP